MAGEGFRIPMSMEILRAGGTPLVLRRGRTAILSLPARLFLAWLSMQKGERAEPPLGLQPSERRRARWWIGGLVAVNATVFFLEEPYANWDRFSENLIHMGARTPNWLEEPWRLATSLFLHVSTLHLLFNMLMLAALGLWVGKIFGWTRAMALYLLSGILGNLIAELLQGVGFGPNPQMALGSSTAIMGLLGAMLGAIYRRPESVPLAARIRFRWAIPLALFLTLGMGLFLRFLDNCAHLGGFLAGLMLVWILPPRFPASGESRGKNFSHH
jgi:GlpG protein